MTRRSSDSVAVGDALPELSKVATREDIAAYAEASLDHNPLHLNDERARARGFDGIIAHGMFTMAHLTTCITEWAGDPAALSHIRAGFRAAVRPGEKMIASGKVVSLDPASRRATLEVWVTVDRDGTIEHAIKRSCAVVLLA